jgi:phenylpropionate dioxygenase-like ring-hydroxylating dioxygenase large terminal subunit
VRTYRDNTAAITALVESDRVHRDAYLSAELFALEQERLFARSWLFVGHASQVPNAGDFVTTDIAGVPVILVRQADASVRVLANRCAHKGAMITSDRRGNTGRAFRCPYHSWSYRTDGSLLAVPVAEGYTGTAMRECETGRGLGVIASGSHRGFVFARLAPSGPSFEDYFGAALANLDAMADRSPEGELEVVGEPLRNLVPANWKIYLENINDSLHANITHESSTGAAEAVWAEQPTGTAKPPAIEQLLPFGSGTEFMAKMGGRVLPNGHSILGTAASIHSAYSAIPEYAEAMTQAYGEARAKEILGWSPQNAVLYPSIALKAAPQVMRVLRPGAVDRTIVEAWTFLPRGAPRALVQRSMLYNRLVFSPMSIVAHDDTHVFETIQRALASNANPWISLHREARGDESSTGTRDVGGLDEALMRNQFRAWVAALTREAAP